MGTDHNIACKTCKVEYYLGYGSYKGKVDYESRFPKEDHEGHDVTDLYSTDYLYTDKDNGHLYFECPWNGRVEPAFIENYDEYKFISFQPGYETMKINQELYDRVYYAVSEEPFLAFRIIQGDPSVKELYKHFKDYGKWVKRSG